MEKYYDAIKASRCHTDTVLETVIPNIDSAKWRELCRAVDTERRIADHEALDAKLRGVRTVIEEWRETRMAAS